MDMKLAQKALDKAKVALMSKPDSVFFTTVCFSLKHVWDDSIPTAQTNGLEIRYNPEFFMQLNEEERVFLLLHEVGHTIFMHVTRRGDRDPILWNIAGDFIINDMLVERGYKMPSGGLHDTQYHGMSTDQVYALLQQNTPQITLPMVDLMEPGSGNEEEPGNSGEAPGNMSPQEVEAKITDILVRASIQSKIAKDKPGTVPGDVEIFLDRMLNPKLPWHQLLRRFLHDRVKEDYSWRKPNRRFFPQHLLPSLHSEGLGHIVFAIDTSGSVSQKDFMRFISEINSVLRQFRPKQMTLIQFDTKIKSIDELRHADDLMRIKFTGRGGTNIKDVLDWTEANKPQALLVFTDGEFRVDNRSIASPLLWLIHNNPRFNASNGEIIHYEMEHAS